MKVNIIYPGLDTPESLEAEPRGVGLVELRQHSGLIPLAPGDRVRVDQSGDITGIEHLESLFTYEVALRLPTDLVAGQRLPEEHPSRKKISEFIEALTRDAWVTRTTNFSFLVSSQSRRWLDDRVTAHPFVDDVELIRTPDLTMSLSVATAHPDVEGRNAGPWS